MHRQPNQSRIESFLIGRPLLFGTETSLEYDQRLLNEAGMTALTIKTKAVITDADLETHLATFVPKFCNWPIATPKKSDSVAACWPELCNEYGESLLEYALSIFRQRTGHHKEMIATPEPWIVYQNVLYQARHDMWLPLPLLLQYADGQTLLESQWPVPQIHERWAPPPTIAIVRQQWFALQQLLVPQTTRSRTKRVITNEAPQPVKNRTKRRPPTSTPSFGVNNKKKKQRTTREFVIPYKEDTDNEQQDQEQEQEQKETTEPHHHHISADLEAAKRELKTVRSEIDHLRRVLGINPDTMRAFLDTLYEIGHSL